MLFIIPTRQSLKGGKVNTKKKNLFVSIQVAFSLLNALKEIPCQNKDNRLLLFLLIVLFLLSKRA